VIHYHGTPITPRRTLDLMGGRNFCISYVSPSDLKTCLRIGQSLMLDNGAFSCKTRGIPFDMAGFYEWVEPHLAHPHWGVVPDAIDGTVEQQREMVKTWPFRKSLGVPVWHMGLPIDYLLELCDSWDRVAIGSTAEFWKIGAPNWCARMDKAFNAMVQTFGTLPWIHGMRMLGQSAGPWPLASADSTNVAQNHHLKANPCTSCMAKRIDSINPPTLWVAQPEQEVLC
jgi:hypothetical protein